MKILLGQEFFSIKNGNPKDVLLDYKKVINPHLILVGGSGTGKTYNLKKLLKAITDVNPSVRFHIMDVHGDIEIENSSTIKFSETTNYGLQPLKLSVDPDFGGVRKRIRSFINALNRTSRKLGTKQEPVLYNLLLDLYAARGFYATNPKTWSETNIKKFPTLMDLKRWLEYKLKHMLFGTSSKTLRSFEEVKKLKLQLDRRIKKKVKIKNEEELLKLEEQIKKTKEKMKEEFSNGVDNLGTGFEIDDLIKYDNPDVIRSLLDRIIILESSGIFKNNAPEFDKNKPIWRYDIKALNRDEQKLFVSILAEDIFLKVKELGETKLPREFIVIDEASIFLQNADDEYILNIIAREARKFGLGLILATQSLEHIPDDIIESTASKIILGVDETKMDITAKKLQVDKQKLKYIIPRKSAMIQVKEGGKNYSPFQNVILNIKAYK